MQDEQLLRYSRHILLNELGVEGQERLLASRALVIGAGGLGSPVAQADVEAAAYNMHVAVVVVEAATAVAVEASEVAVHEQ